MKKIIYISHKKLESIELYEENGYAFYYAMSKLEKRVHQIPIGHLRKDISFTRYYHLSYYIPSAFIASLATYAFLETYQRPNPTGMYISCMGMSFALLYMCYYFIYVRKEGEVILDYEAIKIHLYMSKDAYYDLQTQLSKIKKQDGK